jgi:PAS domain S-box-containing protein
MSDSREGLHAHSFGSDAVLRDGEERFRGAFEAATIGFAVVEHDGRIRTVNRSLCEMLGYTEQELRDQTFEQITHPDDLPIRLQLRDQLLAGAIPNFQLEQRYVRKDGHVVHTMLAVSLVRTPAGAPSYLVSQVTDVTARRAVEEALARHTADLERSNAELEAFAYVASHDLQQPLRTVASYAQLFADRYRARLDERADRWLGFIMGGVARMQRLTDDLLALARISTDGHSFGRADTHAIVERVWEGLRHSYAADDARITIGALPVIHADAAQLGQLFQNLLGNACKYRQPRVPLHVSVTARYTDGAAPWEFAVQDNGIGFSMEHAERIFDIFRRLHHEREYDGTGIGLAICRRIVERHGGRIWARSVPWQGSTFLFTLPDGNV